jgi:hypothetical protein
MTKWRAPLTPGRYTITAHNTATGESGSVSVDVLDEPDTDGDGVVERLDNCASFTNRDQIDSDTDGVGDVCDASPFSDDPDRYGFVYVVVDQNGEPVNGTYRVGGRLGDINPTWRAHTGGYSAVLIEYLGGIGGGVADLSDLVAEDGCGTDCAPTHTLGCSGVPFPGPKPRVVGQLHVAVIVAQCTQNQ